MTHSQAEKILRQQGQAHLLRYWDQLDADERQFLLAQIAEIDFAVVERMQQMLTAPSDTVAKVPRPAPVMQWTSRVLAEARKTGEIQLRRGRVAALLVAGGQGSRLGYHGPKGAYGIGPVSDLPLFYFHARKLVRLAQLYGKPVPLYIMTSAVNDAATRACFEEYCYFGLNPAEVIFFKQGVWPALNNEGQLMLEAPGRIFMSPDGHGGALDALVKNHCLADMQERGIRQLFYFQVDNPLVEIADPAFVGLHTLRRAEISLKLCLKATPHEKMGVVARTANERYRMLEYSEMTPQQAARFKYGSPAIHLFTLAFLKKQAQQELPLHIAHKRIPCLNARGTRITPRTPNGYKFEKFIFDLLPHARRVVNLAFERSEEFSPVKNAQGTDSPESCRAALQAKWRRWLQQAGISVPENLLLEIDPAYAGSAADLRSGLLLG